MPYRRTPLVSGQVYHVVSHSVGGERLFESTWDRNRLLSLVDFYRFGTLPLRYSFYNRLSVEQREDWWKETLRDCQPIVEILAFCFMDNHLHFLLKQNSEDGTSVFMRNLQNSYSHYFNVKSGRIGPLFRPMFKAVIIESNEQLMHVSRYIHLNPVSAYSIEAEDLKNYKWSSYLDYLGQRKLGFVSPDLVLSNWQGKKGYEKFVKDNADYQRRLQQIKHLLMEG